MSIPVLELPLREVGPVPFRVARFDDAVDAICATAGQIAAYDQGLAVHFANAYSIALADTDASYARLLGDPRSAVFTDGVPVAWVGRRAYPGLAGEWDRVYGPDVMEAVFDRNTGLRHYLLGGSPETLAALREAIARRWPDVEVVGADSPPFRPMTAAEVAAQDDRIRQSGADMVWVGLGTPKQDWEAARLAGSVPAVVLAVGAAFDFLAGVKPQAPVWMQRTGTEWAFRLASEPRRLTRRYLWGNPRFLVAAAKRPGLGKARV